MGSSTPVLSAPLPSDVRTLTIILPDGSAALATRPPTAEEEAAMATAQPAAVAREHRTRIVSPGEAQVLIFIGVGIWLVIFFGGKYEWEHEVPRDCDARCAHPCPSSQHSSCIECKDGYINGGFQCFDDPSQLPPISVAAGLGGEVYLVLILLAQVMGITCQTVLMLRVHRRGLLSRREGGVLLIALAIEVVRMLAVDLFVLREYLLSDREYQVYQVPANQTSDPSGDGQYYIGLAGGFPFDARTCSVFSNSSALLDYGTTHGFATGGHPRFSHLGWVLGGEFAMYYFGATVINEVADNLFVVPADTVRWGWKTKLLSIVLEVFQLGALFPAAAFKHGDCLRYMNPLNVPLTPIRDTIVIFGYACWGSVVVIGFASLCGLVLHGVVYTLLVASEWLCMRRPRALRRWRTVMEPCVALHRGIFYTDENSCCGPFGHVFGLYLALAAVPMFIAGGCLGVLVILGQGSKDEPQEIFAAALLLVDVLFKLAATLCCDLAGASLRRTRRRAAPAFAPRRRRRRLHVADGADAAVEGPTRTADVESTTVGAQDDAAIEMPALVPAPVPVHPDDSGWSATTASSPTSTQGNGEAAEALSEARGRAMCAVRSRPSSPSSARVAPAAGRARAAHMSQGRQHV